jgi:uncharacterized protein
MTIKDAASEFLANKRIAVTGVSRKPQAHASNAVYRRLRQLGYEVFAVNPKANQVEGDQCFHDLKSIPGGVEAVVIGTRPEHALATMRQCANLGIRQVWMHRSFGSGSVSDAAAALGARARHLRDRRGVPADVQAGGGPWPRADAVPVHADG